MHPEGGFIPKFKTPLSHLRPRSGGAFFRRDALHEADVGRDAPLDVRLWLKLLKNSQEGSDRAIMESTAAPVRIFVASVDVSANQSCASDLPKSFFNTLG